MKLTTPQVKEIEAKGKEALATLGGFIGIDFVEYDNGNYYIEKDGIRYGKITTDVSKETGIVRSKWKPGTAYNNYAPRKKFSYDATDGVDNSQEFLAWVIQIKKDLDL